MVRNNDNGGDGDEHARENNVTLHRIPNQDDASSDSSGRDESQESSHSNHGQESSMREELNVQDDEAFQAEQEHRDAVLPDFVSRQVSLSDDDDEPEEYFHDEESVSASSDEDNGDEVLSYESSISQDESYESQSMHDDETTTFKQEQDLSPPQQQRQRSSVIAIGIPAPEEEEGVGHDSDTDEETAIEPRRMTAEQLDQEAVSEAVAQVFAEREHLQKQKQKDTSQYKVVARTSSRKKKRGKSVSFQHQHQEEEDEDGDRKLPAKAALGKQQDQHDDWTATPRASLYRLEHAIQRKQQDGATASLEKQVDEWTATPRASLYRLEHAIQRKQQQQNDDDDIFYLESFRDPEKGLVAERSSSVAHGTRRNREDLIYDEEEEDEEEEDLEAQAGIPVVMPGAFAMEGMDALPGRQVTGYDSGFDDDDAESSEQEQPQLESPADQEEPPLLEVEGQVHQEPQLFDGLALMEDEIPPEDIKVPMKVRLLQAAIFLGSLAAIAVIVGLVVGLSKSGSDSSNTNDNDLVGWDVVGEPLRATQIDKDGSSFGSAVSLSANGSRLAVTAPGWDESPSRLDVGHVLVYDWNGNDWELVGQELSGPGPRTTTGGSISLSQTVALSDDGSRLAFASPDWNGGQVTILQEPNIVNGQWISIGQNLTGAVGQNGRFGYSVAMSSTGSIVAVGAPFEATTAYDISGAGVVRVYQEGENSIWSQLGQALVGEGSFELNGWSVALSSDGTRMATGAPGSGLSSSFEGATRVYRLDGTVWTQIGQTIRGESVRDKFGHSISLSDDGTVLAVSGWEKPDANGAIFVGHVRIFKYVEETKNWQQLGSNLVGSESYDDFGYSVALSSDGSKVVVGSPRTSSISGGVPPRGRIDVFVFDGNEWRKQGGTIRSTSDFDNLGHSVALSADSGRIAGGAPGAGYDGKYNDVGKVVVVEPLGG